MPLVSKSPLPTPFQRGEILRPPLLKWDLGPPTSQAERGGRGDFLDRIQSDFDVSLARASLTVRVNLVILMSLYLTSQHK